MPDDAARGSMLAGIAILIVEDQFLIADEMRLALEELGGTVLGPVSTVGAALALLREQRPDVAVLDVDLQGEHVWPVAERLRAIGVPFAFTTGYDAGMVDGLFDEVARLEKPVRTGTLASTLARLVVGPPGQSVA